MKSFFKHTLSMAVVLSLVACSNSNTTQALNDFSYLETAPLREWQSPPDQNIQRSTTYAIPDGDFSGAIGDKVDISPPVELLEIIPVGRYKSSPYQAIFMLPNSSDVNYMNEVIRDLVNKEIIPLQNTNENGIETQWVSLDADKNGVQARYQLSPISQNNENGIQVTFLEARRDEVSFSPSDHERERYNILMANKILLEFDIYMREQASKQAQEQLASIPLELGTDRNGNPVIIARSAYNSFWDRLPAILEPLGFTVEQRNRSQGSVELDYSEPNESFWERIGVEPIKLDARKYQLQLGDLNNRTSISVLDYSGKPINEEGLLSLYEALDASMGYSTN